jgi:hemoglobin
MNPAEPARSDRLLISPGHAVGVTEEMIHAVVHGFYGRIRQDPALGPIFNRVIAADAWPAHLQKMCDFWSSVMLMSGRFKGNPMVAHMRIKTIQPQHFERWLELFRQAAAEVCTSEATAEFVMRAENIARSLQMGLFFRPGAKVDPAIQPPDLANFAVAPARV